MCTGVRKEPGEGRYYYQGLSLPSSSLGSLEMMRSQMLGRLVDVVLE